MRVLPSGILMFPTSEAQQDASFMGQEKGTCQKKTFRYQSSDLLVVRSGSDSGFSGTKSPRSTTESSSPSLSPNSSALASAQA
ncbi:hypothetical protein CROQUDRAFT_89805 [Cronartium quercuum f. sp. fusiforme G11]|uniref:Uncharacterized protein n=1 Tax=Cronartium quercuum f. sp. fusiforme G11 TaxID=708437 RepID=A0A9P6TDT6_9BASI|nr:hypothetical protein CROQUDRAFT_89805 [Cronartium quercuum f. sp. fusiforme G11]